MLASHSGVVGCSDDRLLCNSDEDDFSDMNWSSPLYSRADVNRAGKNLMNTMTAGIESDDHTLAVVDNWRSSHSYPLHVLMMNLRGKVKAIDQEALIAQRLKRLTSIALKLQRRPSMGLTQMQDIGGCRAVVSNALSLDALVARFEKSRVMCWEPNGKKDYIKSPKPDGYRSVHLVYRYANPSPDRASHNKLRIELQIRSRLQHAWATALETVDTFTRQALKANCGDPEWQRFFVLMGHSIAIREGRNPVPGAPPTRELLVEEVSHLVSKLNVIATLQGWATAIKITQERSHGHFFLLTLELDNKRIRVRGFPKNASAMASESYSTLEKESMGNPSIQTVLVSVNSLEALRIAYPNYYMDTSAFLEVVKEDVMLTPYYGSRNPG